MVVGFLIWLGCCRREGQDFGFFFSNRYSVFKVGSWRAIEGRRRPLVSAEDYFALSAAEDGLNGEHMARMQAWAFARRPVVAPGLLQSIVRRSDFAETTQKAL